MRKDEKEIRRRRDQDGKSTAYNNLIKVNIRYGRRRRRQILDNKRERESGGNHFSWQWWILFVFLVGLAEIILYISINGHIF